MGGAPLRTLTTIIDLCTAGVLKVLCIFRFQILTVACIPTPKQAGLVCVCVCVCVRACVCACVCKFS